MSGREGTGGDVTDGAVLVTVSVPDARTGDRVAEVLVAERLAACVKRSGPVRSTYTWRGALEQDTEWVLTCVSRRGRFDALVARVRELHPHEVPEIVATAVVAGDPEYLRWVQEVTADLTDG